MIVYAIKYLYSLGQLTSGLELDKSFAITDNGTSETITLWLFNEPQKTVSELQAILNTAPCQAFIANFGTYTDRIGLKKRLDEQDRFLIKVLIKEINTLRTLHGLPNRTLAQFKAAMDNET